MYKYDFLVVIGRFQPFHIGHERTIREALNRAQEVIVLVGSSNISKSIKNPWSYQQRYNDMIYPVFKDEIEMGRVSVFPLNDYMYNDTAWFVNLQKIVESQASVLVKPRIGVVDFAVDHASYNNSMFKSLGWKIEPLPTISTFHASNIRKDLFRKNPIISNRTIPIKVIDYLDNYIHDPEFSYYVNEFEYHENYTKQYGKGPWNTADAVVTQANHILLVERGGLPGRGQLAFPGGFVNLDETFDDAVVRELLEETEISDGKSRKGMPPAILASYIKSDAIFDDPNRSTRGRVVTRAYHFDLPSKNGELWDVNGADDAASANWYPIGSVKCEQFFEDHYFIMCKMLGLTM